jgi:hypothetical protein
MAHDFGRESDLDPRGWGAGVSDTKLKLALDAGVWTPSLARQADIHLTWDVSPANALETLKRNRALVRAYYDKDGKLEYLRLFAKDASKREAIHNVTDAAWRSGARLFALILVESEGPIVIRVFPRFEDKSVFEVLDKSIQGDDRPCRYATFNDIAIIYIPPDRAMEKRKVAVSNFAGHLREDVQKLKSAEGQAQARETAKRIVKQTEAFFSGLDEKNILDDRTETYQTFWRFGIMERLIEDPMAREVIPSLEIFVSNLSSPPQANRCTVELLSYPKAGAKVKYAKLADAANDKFEETAGETLTTVEVEKAKYIFRAYRGGKLTGETGPVECTKERQLVTISEKP